MKKCVSAWFLLIAMLSVLSVPVAAEQSQPVPQVTVSVEQYGDIQVETRTVIYESLTRSSSKTVEREQTYKSNGTKIATVALTATFGYDGETAWVDSTSVSKTTSGGWSYGGQSIKKSGGTVSLNAKLTKAGKANIAVSISITCSPKGVIS